MKTTETIMDNMMKLCHLLAIVLGHNHDEQNAGVNYDENLCFYIEQ